MSEFRSKSGTVVGSVHARTLVDGRVVLDSLDEQGARVAYNVMSPLEWKTLVTSTPTSSISRSPYTLNHPEIY